VAVLEDDELLEHDKDPIIEYVRETYKKKLPPHKIAFKKQRIKNHDINKEDDDHEDVKYDLSGITFSIRFAEAFSVNLRYNSYLEHIIMHNNNLNDTSFSLLISYLPGTVRKLEISKNPGLTPKSYQLLSEVVVKQRMSISHMCFDG
jgi:hypothetical protein